MALGFTQADLNNLRAALVSGAKRVQCGDRTIEYQSKKELMEIIEMVQNELNGVSESDTDPSVVRATFSRGG